MSVYIYKYTYVCVYVCMPFSHVTCKTVTSTNWFIVTASFSYVYIFKYKYSSMCFCDLETIHIYRGLRAQPCNGHYGQCKFRCLVHKWNWKLATFSCILKKMFSWEILSSQTTFLSTQIIWQFFAVRLLMLLSAFCAGWLTRCFRHFTESAEMDF